METTTPKGKLDSIVLDIHQGPVFSDAVGRTMLRIIRSSVILPTFLKNEKRMNLSKAVSSFKFGWF